jgi:hypothetical protein
VGRPFSHLLLAMGGFRIPIVVFVPGDEVQTLVRRGILAKILEKAIQSDHGVTHDVRTANQEAILAREPQLGIDFVDRLIGELVEAVVFVWRATDEAGAAVLVADFDIAEVRADLLGLFHRMLEDGPPVLHGDAQLPVEDIPFVAADAQQDLVAMLARGSQVVMETHVRFRHPAPAFRELLGDVVIFVNADLVVVVVLPGPIVPHLVEV